MSKMATRAPSAANSNDAARPMPAAPPVTTAVLPARRPLFCDSPFATVVGCMWPLDKGLIFDPLRHHETRAVKLILRGGRVYLSVGRGPLSNLGQRA